MFTRLSDYQSKLSTCLPVYISFCPLVYICNYLYVYLSTCQPFLSKITFSIFLLCIVINASIFPHVHKSIIMICYYHSRLPNVIFYTFFKSIHIKYLSKSQLVYLFKLLSMYVSTNLRWQIVYFSTCLPNLSTFVSVYLSTLLTIYISTCEPGNLFSCFLSILLFAYLSTNLSTIIYVSIFLSVLESTIMICDDNSRPSNAMF